MTPFSPASIRRRTLLGMEGKPEPMSRAELEKLLNTQGGTDEQAKEDALTGTSPNIPTSSLLGTIPTGSREEELIREDSGSP